MPSIFILPASVLALVVLCLHGGYSEAYTVCWTNQQLYMNDQDITTYFPANLACSTGVYSGNYSVQAFKGNFDVQYGDQLCNTDWKNDRYFESTFPSTTTRASPTSTSGPRRATMRRSSPRSTSGAAGSLAARSK